MSMITVQPGILSVLIDLIQVGWLAAKTGRKARTRSLIQKTHNLYVIWIVFVVHCVRVSTSGLFHEKCIYHKVGVLRTIGLKLICY